MKSKLRLQIIVDDAKATIVNISIHWMTAKENFKILNITNEGQRVVLVGLDIVSLFIGLLVRILIIRITMKLNKFLPIGLITALDETIKMVGYTAAFLFNIFAVTSTKPLVENIGPFSCSVIHFLSVAGMIETYIGGLAIAVMRLLYIKCPNLVLNYGWIASGGLAMGSTFLTLYCAYIGTVNTMNEQFVYQACMGQSQVLTELLFEMETRNSTNSSGLKVLWASGLMINIAELAIYITICCHLMRHDRSMSDLLPDAVIKKRLRGNIIGLSGHIIVFLFENYFFAGFIIAAIFPAYYHYNQGEFIRPIMAILPMYFNYGVIGVVTILTSAQLKQELYELLYKLFFVDKIIMFSEVLNFLGVFRILRQKTVFIKRQL